MQLRNCPKTTSVPVNGAILQAEGDDAPALPILHDQVQGKVLDEVVAVVPADIVICMAIMR